MAFNKTTGVNEDGMGGTELMAARIFRDVNPSLLSQFQIIHSRFADVEMDPTKKKILVVHDLPQDSMYDKLENGGWEQFEKIVFVSYWQQQMFNAYRGVPFSAGTVIRNAIEPIEVHEKPIDKIRLVYFSTPHRGLDLLFAAYKQLSKEFENEIELNVYSSFGLYGWDTSDKPYAELFNQLRGHKHINYNKSVSNDKIREILKRNHILAYPSTWQETSCLVLIEAMSAGLYCLHPTLGALPETSFGMTAMYDYNEDAQQHANQFYHELRATILLYKNRNQRRTIEKKLVTDKLICDHHHNWATRKLEWNNLLKRLSY